LNDLDSPHEEAMEEYEEKHPEKTSGFEKFKLGYLRLLESLMNQKKALILGYLVVTIGVVVVGFMKIGKDMMPKLNHSHQFQVRIIGQQGKRIERTELAVKQVIGIIKSIVQDKNIEISSAFVGMTPSSYGTSSLYVFNADPHEATLQVNIAKEYEMTSLDNLKMKFVKRCVSNYRV
jgi:multidrug efflux pump subunit AcrB